MTTSARRGFKPGKSGGSSSMWLFLAPGILIGVAGVGVGIWKFSEAFTTKVEGSLAIVDDGGAQTFLPTTCAKVGGHGYELPDIVLGAEGQSIRIKLYWDRRDEKRQVVLYRGKDKVELSMNNCSVFNTTMDWSGGEAAGDKGVRGHIRLECSVDKLQVKGEVRFDACFRP